MVGITLKRSFAALAVMVGLLAVAGPAGAQGGGADFTRVVDTPRAVTMLDYSGTPVVTYSATDIPAQDTGTQQGKVPPPHRGSAITMLDYEGSP